jgi:RNA-directed DNA polymerase
VLDRQNPQSDTPHIEFSRVSLSARGREGVNAILRQFAVVGGNCPHDLRCLCIGLYPASPGKRAVNRLKPPRHRHLSAGVAQSTRSLERPGPGIQIRKVNWLLDADIRSFFDTLEHGWLVKFIEYRIADRRVIRLIQKWLNAGVLEQGQRIISQVGTVQGGSVSPLLANVYLHYVLDLWAQRWRRREARGDLIIVRFADDFVVGFQYRDDAERFLTELRERFARFGLELHPDKTRLIEFGRFAAQNRDRHGGGKPETFNFLGFTHICAKTRKGKFTVRRKTMRKRIQAKLKAIKIELQRRRHDPVPDQGTYVRSVVSGHARYYGVPLNGPSIGAFRQAVGRLWYRSLRRRSQKTRLTWTRMKRLIARWLPSATICHPYPLERLGVLTQGRSRMR